MNYLLPWIVICAGLFLLFIYPRIFPLLIRLVFPAATNHSEPRISKRVITRDGLNKDLIHAYSHNDYLKYKSIAPQFIMQVIVSLLVLTAALYIILSMKYGESEQKWATGSAGLIVGFWLKH